MGSGKGSQRRARATTGLVRPTVEVALDGHGSWLAFVGKQRLERVPAADYYGQGTLEGMAQEVFSDLVAVGAVRLAAALSVSDFVFTVRRIRSGLVGLLMVSAPTVLPVEDEQRVLRFHNGALYVDDVLGSDNIAQLAGRIVESVDSLFDPTTPSYSER